MLELLEQIHARLQKAPLDESHAVLSRLDGAVRELAEHHRRDSDALERIATATNSQALEIGRMSDTLAKVPETLQVQAEVLRAVQDNLDQNGQRHEELRACFRQFERSVDSMREAGAVQVETLQRVLASHEQQRQRLTEFVRLQQRRFAICAVALGAAVLIGAGLVAWALLR